MARKSLRRVRCVLVLETKARADFSILGAGVLNDGGALEFSVQLPGWLFTAALNRADTTWKSHHTHFISVCFLGSSRSW